MCLLAAPFELSSFWKLEKCEENLHRFGITAQDIANLRQDARIVELLGILSFILFRYLMVVHGIQWYWKLVSGIQ